LPQPTEEDNNNDSGVPKTMAEIFQLSYRNRKRNKREKKKLKDSENDQEDQPDVDDRGKKRPKVGQDTMEFMKDIGWVPGQQPIPKNLPFVPYDYELTDANFAIQPTSVVASDGAPVKEGSNYRGGVTRFIKPKSNRSMSFRSNNDNQGHRSANNSQTQWPRR